jgi:type IV pilus assembly protein PilN
MRPPINLAAHPFRNERLPTLLFALGLVVLVGVSVEHALVIRHLLPDRTSALHAEAAALEKEVAELRADGARLRGPGPDKLALERWTRLKELVDRRSFAWTGLMARLEGVLPHGVRLVSIQPDWHDGDLKLDLDAVARDSEAGFALVKALDERPEFEDVYPLSKDDAPEAGEVRFRYSMRYKPAAAPIAVEALSQPAADAAAADDEEKP